MGATVREHPPDLGRQRASRLAELVAELTGCDSAGALHAVREEVADSNDVLQVVAKAMRAVDQPVPEGFRVARYLRPDEHGAAAGGSPR
jgi:hypothetical protein